MEDNGYACVVGALFKASLKLTSLVCSSIRSAQSAGCISSLNTGHAVIINFSRVTCRSWSYLFPEQTCCLTSVTGHGIKIITFTYELYQSTLSWCNNSNIINVYTFINATVSSSFCDSAFVLNSGLIGLVGAAVRPPELQVSFHQPSLNTWASHTALCCFQKDMPEMRLNNAQMTMKHCSWCCCSRFQEKHYIKMKKIIKI